jgi:hypothetical protein
MKTFLCKIGLHKFVAITETVKETGWASIFNGEYISHYECSRCKLIEQVEVAQWDGTDGY